MYVRVSVSVQYDPRDLASFGNASRDAYCRVAGGEERTHPPEEPGGKPTKSFRLTGDELQTRTIRRTLEPKWDEPLSLRLDAAAKSSLRVDVYDDTCAADDEHDHCVGRAVVKLQDLLGAAKDGQAEAIAWIPLRDPDLPPSKGWRRGAEYRGSCRIVADRPERGWDVNSPTY